MTENGNIKVICPGCGTRMAKDKRGEEPPNWNCSECGYSIGDGKK